MLGPRARSDVAVYCNMFAVDQPSACGTDAFGHVSLCKQWFMINGARAFGVFTILLTAAAISITVLFLMGKSEKTSHKAAIYTYCAAGEEGGCVR